MSTQPSLGDVWKPVIPEEDEKRLRAIAATVTRNHPDKWTAFEFALRAYHLGGRACHEATTPVEEEPLSMVELEKRAIAKAMVRANGNALRAARLLGIGRTTLYRKISEYKLRQIARQNYCCPVCGVKLDRPIVGPIGEVATA